MIHLLSCSWLPENTDYKAIIGKVQAAAIHRKNCGTGQLCNRTIIKPQKRETNVDQIESSLEVLWGKLYTFSFYSPAIWMESKCFIIWKVCVISIEVWRRWGIPAISSFDSLLACCVVGVWTFDSSLALLKTNCTFRVSSYVQWNVCLKYM